MCGVCAWPMHTVRKWCFTHTIIAFQPDTLVQPFDQIVSLFLCRRGWRKGLVHTARACVGVSIATGRVTIVIVHRFCMICSSNNMDDKQRVYDGIHFFWGPPLEGPGYEAK